MILTLFTVLLSAQAVVDTGKSPYAKLHPVPVRAVSLAGGYWEPRRRVNVEKSIPTMLQLIEQHGAVDNFRRLTGKKNVARRGPLYTDSDVYKWMEAVAFVLESEDNPTLRAQFDSLTEEILAAQEPSGYLNTYYVDDRVSKRFSEMNRSHELYCLGHLLQAAIAFYRATGNRRLLDGGVKMVDYLIRDFGPDKRPLLTGHPELEMSLVELYRTTGERKYLDLAGYLLSGVERERLGLKDGDIKYMFSGIPFTARTQFEGHAVRAMYASCGAADYYAETGREDYWNTLTRLYDDLTGTKMYITGGVGSRSQGEAFGEAYELPNANAYTESCAAIGNLMWNYRMQLVDPKGRYSDVIERALYNGIASGVSLEGTLYCYRNPLASSGEKIRNPWYDTTCCPPNIQRILASLPGYFYATGKDGLYVLLYDKSALDWHLEDGTKLKVTQQTEYPWKGDVTVKVEPERATEFSLFLRIPAWSRTTRVEVNGQPVKDVKSGEFLAVKRTWMPGDSVTLHLDMAPALIAANPRVTEDSGRVAVQRGPLVYCLEGLDQQGVRNLVEVELTRPEERFAEEVRKNLLGGVVVLKHAGQTVASSGKLYERFDERAKPSALWLTFVPYYAWANREPGPMEVWVPVVRLQ